MPQLDDFPDDLGYDPSPRPDAGQGVSRGLWIVAILLVAAGLAAGIWWRMTRTSPAPVETAAADEPAPAPRELGAPADRVPLPPLAESDPFVRQLVQALSSHPQLAAWLVPNNLIDRFVVVVDNVAEGRRPATHLRMLAPREPFRVAEGGSDPQIDPRSYDRYNLVADVIGSIDAAGAARLYTTLKPLIEEAYRQQGYPDRRFDDTLARAIGRLLDTPAPDANVRLVAGGVTYKYADPALEARAPVEKQFIRMGPRNVRIIQDKLREIARELGMQAASTPG